MIIRVHDLEKRHAGVGAPTLRGVRLELRAGATAALLGPSGAGKTTLLRCLVGLEPFDRGAIEVDGVRVTGAADGGPARARAAAAVALRGRVGLVFQSFELFPHLRVLANCVLAPMRVRGLARPAAEARSRALLGELGLADHAGAYPEQLSGGQRQRVAIARALAMEPRLLLYDEPTSALDPSLKGEVAQTLQRVRATGVTQLVVTHDVQLAREAADQVFVLAEGRIVEEGPASRVLGAPEAEATRRLVAGWGRG